MVDAPGLPQDSLQVRWWPFLQLARRFEVNRITNPSNLASLDLFCEPRTSLSEEEAIEFLGARASEASATSGSRQWLREYSQSILK